MKALRLATGLAGMAALGLAAVGLHAQSGPAGTVGGVPIPEIQRMQREAAEANAAEMERRAHMPRFAAKRSWGAVAYDDAAHHWGISDHFKTEDLARQSAVAACGKAASGNCRSVLTFSNQCAAVVRSVQNGVPQPGRDSVNTGESAEKAASNAYRSCVEDWGTTQCKLLLSTCSHAFVWQTGGDPAYIPEPK